MFKRTVIIAALTSMYLVTANEDTSSLATETITTEKSIASENGSHFKKRRLERNYKTFNNDRKGPFLHEKVDTLTDNVNVIAKEQADMKRSIELLREELKQEATHIKDLIMAQQVEAAAPVILEQEEVIEEQKNIAAPEETSIDVQVQDVVL